MGLGFRDERERERERERKRGRREKGEKMRKGTVNHNEC